MTRDELAARGSWVIPMRCACGCSHEIDVCAEVTCFFRPDDDSGYDLAFSRLVMELPCPIWGRPATMTWESEEE